MLILFSHVVLKCVVTEFGFGSRRFFGVGTAPRGERAFVAAGCTLASPFSSQGTDGLAEFSLSTAGRKILIFFGIVLIRGREEFLRNLGKSEGTNPA